MNSVSKTRVELALAKIDEINRRFIQNGSDMLKLEADMCRDYADLLRKDLSEAQPKPKLFVPFSKEREPVPYSIN